MKNQHKPYVVFTKEMKKTYTILAPDMLPMHFRLLLRVLEDDGYKTELLQTHGPQIAETGLKYVHNDTCYPAILVIGQFIDALKSGKYDTHKVALILFQTGGGCRASNYIFLLRKALSRAGFDYIPVISFSLLGLENHPGFKLSLPVYLRMAYGILYADLLMSLENQCIPYEKTPGATKALSEKLTCELTEEMSGKMISLSEFKRRYRSIIDEYAKIARSTEKRVRVGVVGEIYVKYSPLGNNGLVDFLNSEGAEAVVPGLYDFMLYCIYENLLDYKLYGLKKLSHPVFSAAYRYALSLQKELIDIVKDEGSFNAPAPFAQTLEGIKPFMNPGVKMGEGWLLPAEMLELYHSGVKNIVCAQPFGCLPNHIVGKGMMKPFKDAFPDMNIVAIDYDAGATRVNQENRIKLMLSNANIVD